MYRHHNNCNSSSLHNQACRTVNPFSKTEFKKKTYSWCISNVLVTYNSSYWFVINCCRGTFQVLAGCWLKAAKAQPQIHVRILATSMKSQAFFSELSCTALPPSSWWEKPTEWSCSRSKLRGGFVAWRGGQWFVFVCFNRSYLRSVGSRK